MSNPTDPHDLSALPPPPSPQSAAVPGPERWLVAAGIAAVIIGALLPWVTITAVFIGTVSLAGTEGDGVLTLILGIVAAAVGFQIVFLGRPMSRTIGIAIAILALIIGGIAGYDMVNIQSAIGDISTEGLAKANIGIGLWITGLGALTLLAAGALGANAAVQGANAH